VEEIQVLGLKELEEKLEALPKKLADRGVRKALKAGSNVIYRIMESLCPRVEKFIPGAPPGWLADHLGTKIKMLHGYIGGYAYIGPQGKVDFPIAEVAKLGTGGYRVRTDKKGRAHAIGRVAVASVARFLEFGTSKMGRHPFMTQAAEAGKMQAIDSIAHSLRDTLEEK
jgi:HK97 gp10 family phage protein